MNWQKLKTVKKGNVGEQIVLDFLSERGFIVYQPVVDGAHKIDFFAHKSGKSKNIIAAEVKSKRRMAKYAETGFNVSAYEHYKEVLDKHKVDTFCFFVDDFEGCIYGAWLSTLGDGNRRGAVITWRLDRMRVIRKLTDDEISELTKHTSKTSYDYSRVKKHFTHEKTI